MNKRKSDAVKDIDNANISGHKYRYRINISKGDVGQPLL